MKIYVQFHDHDGQEVRVSGSSAVMRECVGVGRPPSPLVEIHPVLRKSMTTMTTIDPGEGAAPHSGHSGHAGGGCTSNKRDAK